MGISGTGKNVLYYNCKIDFRSAQDLRNLINQIDAIINELMANALNSVSSGNIAEYELDTGQNRTKIKYTSMNAVMASVENFERLRQMYITKLENKLYGSRTQLVDQSNFRTR